jgi:peroxin-10
MLVFAQAILPYLYTRGVAEFKKRARHQSNNAPATTTKEKASQFLKSHLTSIQDFFVKNVQPVHLAIFYFFGAYYSFSKRFTGIRYVSFFFFFFFFFCKETKPKN